MARLGWGVRREVMREKEKRKEKKECRKKKKSGYMNGQRKEIKGKKEWEMKNWGKLMREDQKLWRETIATF